MDKTTVLNGLKQYFGHSKFRSETQENAIKTIIKREQDVYVSMPTGSGKSLCFQLPAVLHKGKVAIVFSPLIALMKEVETPQQLGNESKMQQPSAPVQEREYHPEQGMATEGEATRPTLKHIRRLQGKMAQPKHINLPEQDVEENSEVHLESETAKAASRRVRIVTERRLQPKRVNSCRHILGCRCPGKEKANPRPAEKKVVKRPRKTLLPPVWSTLSEKQRKEKILALLSKSEK